MWPLLGVQLGNSVAYEIHGSFYQLTSRFISLRIVKPEHLDYLQREFFMNSLI